MNILRVLTSHDKLGETGLKTGFWLEEFASPYFVFKDQGVEVTLASQQGGYPSLDPKSDVPDFQTEATTRFRKVELAQQALANTERLDSRNVSRYDAVFYPGGHGPLWDLTEDKHSSSLIEDFYRAGKPVGLTETVPFLVEDMLKGNEGLYRKGEDWGSNVEVDKNLVTGQNPASSEAAALSIIKLLESSLDVTK